MAKTHHFRYKKNALAYQRKARREGFQTSMHATKSGYSVAVWRA